MAYAAVLMAAGAMYKAYASTEEAAAQNRAAVANAQISEENARLTQNQYSEEARRAAVVGRKTMGQARANAAASGLKYDGSVLDVMNESAANLEMDVLTIKQQGAFKAKGYEDSAYLDRMRGRNAIKSGYMRAAGDLLSGAGSVYGSGAS